MEPLVEEQEKAAPDYKEETAAFIRGLSQLIDDSKEKIPLTNMIKALGNVQIDLLTWQISVQSRLVVEEKHESSAPAGEADQPAS